VILAVDSSGATGVAVVAPDGEIRMERVHDDPRAHAEAIGPLLDEALRAVGAGAITAVAYGVGPGPFTGLRVGMAAARMAALALGVPELPVLSHDALAVATGRTGPFVVSTDAKRRERYFTPYSGLDDRGLPVRTAEPAVGAESAMPDLPRVEGLVRPGLIGRIAALREAAGLPPEDRAARYLRHPDVTPAPPRRIR
jgi:tRNA threonylcarbamoyl adenosine modification protein YeaZ